MKKIDVLHPAKGTKWYVDVIFLAVPLLLLLPSVLAMQRPPGHEADGTVWADGSFGDLSGPAGLLADVVAGLVVLFLLGVALIAGVRLFYRVRNWALARQRVAGKRQ